MDFILFSAAICVFIKLRLSSRSGFSDKKSGKGKDKIDDEDITFQRMVAKVSESALLLDVGVFVGSY